MAPIQLPGATEKPPDLPHLNIALRQGLQGAVIVTMAPETVVPTVQVICPHHAGARAAWHGLHGTDVTSPPACRRMPLAVRTKVL